MKFSSLKYKSLLVGATASLLMATSCKDFLDVDVYDQYSPTSLKSKSACEALSNPLYGGYKWFQYESKFSWCVNEGISGILFNVNDQEGALFCLSIGDDNTILKEGYTSLYSGVIAHCNSMVGTINTMLSENNIPEGMTRADLEGVLAEGRLFRGYAHFLATEYFGEVPVVWNTETDMSNNIVLPCMSRETVYEAVRQDLQYAYEHLPERPTETWRASKYSAGALLAKLYLTMASCKEATPGLTFPYVCPNSAELLGNAKTLLDEIIDSKVYALEKHSKIFAAENRLAPTDETILALYWRMGSYGEGSAYQAQMAPSSDWSPGSGWGSGKGITYTLYNSFADNDARKKELCFFVGKGAGNGYTTVDGTQAWYGSDYTAKHKADASVIGQSGKDFLAQGQHLLNNIKKYVWGVDGTSTHSSGMSINRRQDIIRLSDIYMMRAEVLAMQASDDVNAPLPQSSLDDINAVLAAHDAPTLSLADSVRYFQDLSGKHPVHETFSFTVTVSDGAGGSKSETVSVSPDNCSMFHGEVRNDFLQQRRKEFAMEGSGWLDLKRFYYRNPKAAESYLWQIDRGCSFTNSPEIPEGDARFQNETGYARLALVNKCNAKLKADHPAENYTVGDSEVEVFTQTFIDKNRWYLPIPSSAKAYLSGVQNRVDDVKNGSYPY